MTCPPQETWVHRQDAKNAKKNKLNTFVSRKWASKKSPRRLLIALSKFIGLWHIGFLINWNTKLVKDGIKRMVNNL